MSVYLLDYENVHFSGLEGVENLTSRDTVVMFYGNDASTLPMDLHIKIVESGAKLSYIKIEKMAKNYLDFQLSAISGYLVATTDQTDFIVVSNDKGFDSVLDLWNNADFVGRKLTFCRRDKIYLEEKAKKPVRAKKPAKAKEPLKAKEPVKAKEAEKPTLTEAQKKRIRGEVKELNLKPNDYNKIYRSVIASKDKHEYNIELVRAFKDQELGNMIYKATKKEFAK